MVLQYFKKNKSVLKQNIIIEQTAEFIIIKGSVQNNTCEIVELKFQNREKEEFDEVVLKNKEIIGSFNFNLNLLEELNLEDDNIYDLYFTTRWKSNEISEDRKMKIKDIITNEYIKDGVEYLEYPVRAGRFLNTDFKESLPLNIGEFKYQLYTTVQGSLSLSTKKHLGQRTDTQINRIKMKNNNLKISGKIFTKTQIIENLKLEFRSREGTEVIQEDLKFYYLNNETNKKYGLRRYRYKGVLNFTKQTEMLKEGIYDAFLVVKYKGLEEEVVRLGNPRFIARNHHGSSKAQNNEKVYSISSYYTFRLSNLSLQIDEFEEEAYKYLEKALKRPKIYNIMKKEDVWIVGERRDKAQDTGFRFFKYMRENHPEKKVYYVIDKSSIEYNNVKPYGNVIEFKSKEHIELLLKSSNIVGSHHPDYLYPLRTKGFERKIVGKKTFIQHGVLGTKNMIANYGADAKGFDTDLFLVSSQKEKEIIVNDLGYDQEEVKITGLSRFDDLFKDNIELKRQILIIPTWREWLSRDELFVESEYYERYQELISSNELKELSEKYNFEVVFCLHPNMQRYADLFETSHVKLIYQGDKDVQDLLKESLMMITDYSSVAFDFSFLNKPVIYYQFDREKFIGKRGSHLDLNNDLPGDIVNELDTLIKKTEDYAMKEFRNSDSNALKSSKFIKYKDGNSSERIYNAINNFKPQKSIQSKIVNSELYLALFRKFRKSKQYFPIMKFMYKIMRRVLPLDEKMIIFESGIGKQFADSPRCIYEELVNRNLDYKFIWVSNKRVRFKDVNTKRINRLSPSYYYYLAKSKYWVNNQNFPSYIRKSKKTVYLQTWHGTPLKKMLNDLDRVIGRSDNYLESITEISNDWDYLVSPSKYASKKFKSAFKFKNDIIETGYPRNDLFFSDSKESHISEVKKRLDIPKDKKIILYAPTFRDNEKSNNKFQSAIKLDLEKMQKNIGNDFILLIRLHVIVTNNLKINEDLKDFVINVSDYHDMQELLLVSDVLITDYSSSMFDFANSNKPMLFFTYDLEEYRDNIRGFYIDFEEEAPGPLLRNTNEVIEGLKNIEELSFKYKDKYNDFTEKYCKLEDGHATNRVVDIVFDK